MSDTIVDVVADQDDIEETQDQVADTEEGADDLGPKGTQALDRMKARARAAEAELRAERQRVADLLAEKESASKSPDEQALDAARREARAEALAENNARLVNAEIKAAAKGVLADPTDAALYLKAADFEVSDDGEVDAEAITEAIADLLARKPHLAAERKGPVVPKDSINQGPRDKNEPSLEEQAQIALKNGDIAASIRLKQAAAAKAKAK